MLFAQSAQIFGNWCCNNMNKLLTNPLLLLGAIIRFGLIFGWVPLLVQQWYAPFLAESISPFTVNPWGAWLASGGDFRAFPYGYVMWLVFMPLTILAKYFQMPVSMAYGLTLMASDFALLILLRQLFWGRSRLLLITYWLSPIVIVGTYILGFNDLVPVALLVYALFFIKNNRFYFSGFVIILAISAKLSMVIALPFFFIYFLHNKTYRPYLNNFIKGLVVSGIFFICPFFLSVSGMQMVLNNSEAAKIYELSIPLGLQGKLYLMPLVYLLMIYAAWRVKRLNFELFYVVLGVAFLIVVLMTPASLGWFIWAIPIFVAFQLLSDRIAIFLVGLFSALFLAQAFIQLSPYISPESWFGIQLHLDQLQSLIQTIEVAIGVVLAVRIWREAISRNDFFRFSQKPFVLGIAGDSGAGKDTLANALEGLFGRQSVTLISGDDYHLWDRQKPMWQVMTHLNPMANDLEGFATDLLSLSDGRRIESAHYDHKTGKKGRKHSLRSNDIIIASGLHALYLRILRDCYDLSIYLDMDEKLRRHLKIKRDVVERGHGLSAVLNSFDRREADSNRFIRSQSIHADIVFSVQPIHPNMLEEGFSGNMSYKLHARSRHGLSEVSLQRVLIGICGLHVDMVSIGDGSEVEMVIEGEVSAEDIAVAARLTYPQIFEFLDIIPQWEGGVLGLMQFITLSHINQALKKRIL